jgi:hypothetical protein
LAFSDEIKQRIGERLRPILDPIEFAKVVWQLGWQLMHEEELESDELVWEVVREILPERGQDFELRFGAEIESIADMSSLDGLTICQFEESRVRGETSNSCGNCSSILMYLSEVSSDSKHLGFRTSKDFLTFSPFRICRNWALFADNK